MTNEELVKQIKEGHNELMSDLYEQNKPIIRMIAQRLQPDINDYEDALQNAYLGLVEAVNGYDESTGYKFITYAGYHIRQAIKRGNHDIRHIPEYLAVRANTISRAQNELAQQLDRMPTTAELSRKTGLSIKAIKYTLKAVMPVETIYKPLGEDFTIADTIQDNTIDFENDIAEADEQRYLHTIVNELPERERQVIQSYYFQGLTYSEIGQRLNVSPERVRILKKQGLRYLQHPKMIRKIIGDELDRCTLFYKHRGIRAFNNTWTSSTEKTVLEREYLRNSGIIETAQKCAKAICS
ncbi:MAG: sigma-70 family RNA polymerase sigma factor [Candidatus Ornithomonoglobus sp.]